MTTITINSTKKTIELTKRFAAAAAKFGSAEYAQLQQARRDYPDFLVVTVSAKSSAKKNSLKGLTYAYMEAYIAAHDDENNSIMKEYQDLRANSNDAKEACAEAVSYGEIKEWFLNKYPAIREFHERREKLLENIAA